MGIYNWIILVAFARVYLLLLVLLKLLIFRNRVRKYRVWIQFCTLIKTVWWSTHETVDIEEKELNLGSGTIACRILYTKAGRIFFECRSNKFDAPVAVVCWHCIKFNTHERLRGRFHESDWATRQFPMPTSDANQTNSLFHFEIFYHYFATFTSIFVLNTLNSRLYNETLGVTLELFLRSTRGRGGCSKELCTHVFPWWRFSFWIVMDNGKTYTQSLCVWRPGSFNR